jgi:16S rRNA (guanine966-N2)-methyltransferase
MLAFCLLAIMFGLLVLQQCAVQSFVITNKGRQYMMQYQYRPLSRRFLSEAFNSDSPSDSNFNSDPNIPRKKKRSTVGLRPKEQGRSRPVLSKPHSPNNLRIVGGALKGRKLDSPNVYLRPMMSKVRMALFNSIASIMEINDLTGFRVLDVYSGSGCVGLEALSRGATHATFVDLSSECSKTCKANVRTCGLDTPQSGASVSVVTADAQKFLANPSKFTSSANDPYDLLIFSPPYREISFSSLTDSICTSRCLGVNSLVAIEYPKELGLMPPTLAPSTKKHASTTSDVLLGLRNRSYGRTLLALFIHQPSRTYYPRLDEFSNSENHKFVLL